MEKYRNVSYQDGTKTARSGDTCDANRRGYLLNMIDDGG
jgi:hypothetical protein